jgi:hypothetical protein
MVELRWRIVGWQAIGKHRGIHVMMRHVRVVRGPIGMLRIAIWLQEHILQLKSRRYINTCYSHMDTAPCTCHSHVGAYASALELAISDCERIAPQQRDLS